MAKCSSTIATSLWGTCCLSLWGTSRQQVPHNLCSVQGEREKSNVLDVLIRYDQCPPSTSLLPCLVSGSRRPNNCNPLPSGGASDRGQ
eukprot:581532-Rhodomonas_salina.1